MSDEEEERLALVVTVEHVDGPVAPGSVIEQCPRCNAPVWVAPQTKRAFEVGMVNAMACCDCLDMHNPIKLLQMISSNDLHFHEFRGGLCDCGTTQIEWDAEPEEIRSAMNELADMAREMRDRA